MKQTLLLIGLVLSLTTVAQKSKVIGAYQYMTTGDLENAKLKIDEATTHEKTKIWAKTWFYKGEIYKNIILTKDSSLMKNTENIYAEAYRAYQKAIVFDEKKRYNEDCEKGKTELYTHTFNLAVSAFNAKDFEKSYEFFGIVDKMESKDLASTLQVKYLMSTSAMRLEQFDDAKNALTEIVNLAPDSIDYTYALVDVLDKMNDVGGKVNILSQMNERFASDLSIVSQNDQVIVSTWYNNDQLDKHIEALELKVRPNKHLLALTYIFSLNNITDPLVQTETIAKAEKLLKEVASETTNHPDANYWLGILYVRRGKLYAAEAEVAFADGKSQKGKDIEMTAKMKFEKALNHFLTHEKSIDKENKQELVTLYQEIISCYVGLRDIENQDIYKKKIDALIK